MGDVLSFIGAYRNTQAANAQAEANAYTAQANAKIANANAALEASRLQTNLSASRRKFDQAAGSSRSQFALLGFNGGSALDVMADLGSQAIFEQNSLVKESIGAQTSYKNQSSVYRAAASNLLSSRQSPILNGSLAAASYIVNAATSFVTGGMINGSGGTSPSGSGAGNTSGASSGANANNFLSNP